MLACIPLTAAQLRALADAELSGLPAHAPTPALAEAHGYDAVDDEDADFAALTYASIACLATSPRRLVATAEVRVTDAADELGRVVVPALRLADVTGLFVDEDAVAALVAAARDAVAQAPDLETAMDAPAVEALLAEADLLWYAPEERDDVLAMMED